MSKLKVNQLIEQTKSCNLKSKNLIDELVKRNNLNEDPWIHILKYIKFDPEKKQTVITANNIKDAKESWKGKKASQFEPRLLCKQDTKEGRPAIFKLLNINIISIKNGTYILTHSNIYTQIDYTITTDIIEIQKDKTSLILNIGHGEITMLDNLRYSKVFERPEILGEPILYGPLLGGRHRCNFKMYIDQKKIQIKGSQFETDACYESKNKVLLIESKCSNKCTSFNIRQLYYPYRTIYDVIQDKKEIISIFINCDKKNIIHIFKYIWKNPMEFNSILCDGYYKFKFIN
jgi:hypothetical protein